MTSAQASGAGLEPGPGRRRKLFGVVLVLLSTIAADQLIGFGGAWWTGGDALIWQADRLRDGVRRHVAPDEQLSAAVHKKPDEFAIGVFGGSVAGDLFESHRLESAPELASLEQKLGKHIRFVRLAFGGGSQPAQFYLLNFFHDHFDAIILLDGFNEMAQRGREGCEAFERSPELRRQVRETYEAVRVDMRAFSQRMESWWWPLLMYSGTYRLLQWRENVRLAAREQDALSRWQPGAWDMSFREPLERWSSCVEATSAFARSKGISSFFFLQPNQYVTGSKPMSEAETRVAIQPHSGAGTTDVSFRHLDELYALFEGRISRLQAKGIRITSLVHVFKETAEPVYRDSCCHVNALGNQLLASAILRELLSDGIHLENRATESAQTAPP